MERSSFIEIFGYEPDLTVTAPGRTELGGNHTDHQHGKVLAAPVDLAMKAWVGGEGRGVIRVYSEGYGMFTVDISDGSRPEYGTPEAIIKGVAAEFANITAEDGLPAKPADSAIEKISDRILPGFDAYIESDIPAGSGLSSSAALEILICRICCRLTGRSMTPVEMAKLGQKVENIWFGKPCGLMDQTACASDGIVAIDFEDPGDPKIRSIDFDFHSAGYDMVIVKCGAGHEDLTDCYARITQELKSVCKAFGREYLRDVPEDDFYGNIAELRKKCGDRAVLRAMHVYDDNRRVEAMCDALTAGDIDTYLKLVNESGRSSWELLQNVIPEGASVSQDLALTLALAGRILGNSGAVRVHGGGFAGTIQAYVPSDLTDRFIAKMDSFLGAGSCILLNI